MKSINKYFNISTAIILLLIVTQACRNFYKVSKNSNVAVITDTVSRVNMNRYYILRSGLNAYYMNDILISPDRKSITCTLDNLPPEHQLHLRNGRGGDMRFKVNQ